MSTKHEYLPERVAFGSVLAAWFKKNEWPQSITESVAKALGWPNGPWASQMSTAVNGKIDPKPNFFLAMGMFNQLVAERDLKGIKDRRTIDRLKEAYPLTHDNGVPYDGADFFRLFTGLIEPPEEFNRATTELTFTDEGALAHGENVARTFKALARDQMLSPKEAWEAFKNANAAKKMKPEQLDYVQDIMRGAEVLTGEAMTAFCKDWDGECAPLEALVEVAAEDGKKVREILEKTLYAASA